MKKKPKFYVDWPKRTVYVDGKAIKSREKTGYLNWIPVEVTYTPPVAVVPSGLNLQQAVKAILD